MPPTGARPASQRQRKTSAAITKRLGVGAATVARAVALRRLASQAYPQVRQGRLSGHAALPEARYRERTKYLASFARAPALPNRRLPVLLADPPWAYANTPDTDSRRVENLFPTMSVDTFCRLPVPRQAPEDTVLYLWMTSPFLPEALTVISAWCFTYKTCAVWVKDRLGMGYFFRQRQELLLLATRGSMPTPRPGVRPDSVIVAPRKQHSKKPDETVALNDRMYPRLLKVELFAREARKGWTAWGNE